MPATAENLTCVPNGIYTIENAEGKYITLKVKRQADDARFAPGEYVLSIFKGRDNDNDLAYKGFAFVKPDGIVLWRKARQDNLLKYAAELIRAAALPLENPGVDDNKAEVTYDFRHCGRLYHVSVSRRCAFCNRRLTTPGSIRHGYGPNCAERNGLPY